MAAIITLSLLAILVLYLGLYKAQKFLLPVSLIGLATAIGFLVRDWQLQAEPAYSGMILFDHFAIAFAILCIAVTAVLLLLIKGYFDDLSHHLAEYYSLLLFSLTGAILVTAYHNFALLFMGIEIMSVALYILVGIRKKDFASNEAALKYFIMGAFSTGFLLFGITLIYGASGSFDLAAIRDYVALGQLPMMFYGGVLLLIVGLLFKVGAAPFHFWTADVYEGAPILITAYMSTVVKIASFAALLRLFSYCFIPVSEFWTPLFLVISGLTLVIGNLSALVQVSFKRMLAYSSISHAGYLLFALVGSQDVAANSLFMYVTAYAVATVVAFGVLIIVKRTTGSDHFEAFNGLSKKNPLMSLLLTVAMLSLAGIPLTAGFIGKFMMFSSLMSGTHIALLVVAIINAAIGICYYLRVVIAMYFKPVENEQVFQVGINYYLVFIILGVVTLLLGIFPNSLLQLI
ncbi:NADH-quinone oxidoreductase subunit N [Sphingobacteriaceae bacterium WQ 2009]|uniref:NADH-quinone oxidoreductase subunit N n=1 Tax=Rhinopithecimicrobium faecis TaxID=2820698 RepID=A0A8T4HDN4_9SPHI|nr:NADH-quinone oxidoreductase subunit N [Sphingobacteriaceae bacterium WQ 2009]